MGPRASQLTPAQYRLHRSGAGHEGRHPRPEGDAPHEWPLSRIRLDGVTLPAGLVEIVVLHAVSKAACHIADRLVQPQRVRVVLADSYADGRVPAFRGSRLGLRE
jgi:hypothetical protein